MIGICLSMTDLDLFFDSMATNFMAKFGYMHLFGRAAFENGLQYRHSDSKIFNGNTCILATFYAKMMKIGPVTPEITRVINAPFWMRRQKSVYLTKYLTNYWTDLHQRFSFRGSPRNVVMVTD